MYSILIADDDPEARSGLRALPIWRRLGVSEIFEAQDGAQALRLFEQRAPDLLITDVKMPHMDGVELARRAREKSNDVKIVFISGYDDVSYIKSALTVSACDYILKPIDIKELEACLQRAIMQLASAANWRAELNRLRDQTRAGATVIRDNLFSILINNPLREGELTAALSALDIRDTAIMRVIAVRALGCEDAYPILAESVHALNIDMEKGLYAIIIEDASERDALALARAKLMALKAAGAAYAAAGVCAEGALALSDLRACYLSARDALAHCFYRPPFTVVASADSGERRALPSPAETRVSPCLTSANDNDIDEYLLNIARRMRLSRQTEAGAYMRAFDVIAREAMGAFIDRFGFAAEDEELSLDGALNRISQGACLDDMLDALSVYLRAVRRALQYKDDEGARRRIRLAADYIRQNLHLQLTVTDIAGYVYLAPTYLCVLFRKETGFTINAYITRERMELAKRLLRDASMKQYDICTAIGYKNPSYFTRQFKRYTGLTPSEYREQNGGAPV